MTTELKFDNRTTKVQQLIDYIQKSISARELKVGDKLPSINHLSEKFSISRDTVFKAFSDLKKRRIIDSVHGKSYYVSAHDRSILLLLDEYTPFKEVLYNTLRTKLPSYYNIDLWFHQYNEHLFNQIISNSAGMYSKYIVMNYHNEKISKVLSNIDKKKLLLLDFGKFDKKGYSYVCQDFDEALYNALETIKQRLEKYNKLYFLFDKNHKHPQSSKQYFSQFCIDNNLAFEIIDEYTDNRLIQENAFYLVIKQQDIVNIIKQGKRANLTIGKDYGLLAYNDNPFFEIVENGVSSIGINWEKMGELAALFVAESTPIHLFLPTIITDRNSF
ncbi:MAG: GntR family transcriptional regulator [Proteiniphilum sp.]|nr:GntR family transcriptional regulator [Proteiniphilum sp.]